MGAEKRDGDQQPFENDDETLAAEINLVNKEIFRGPKPE